ncbi:MAG: DNA adenine methylase [bacterium]
MKMPSDTQAPHPFPYQGSKREIARHILPHFPHDVECLVEPFCGASAVSIAALARGLARRVILNDLNAPLIALWREILDRPIELTQSYEKLWNEQHPRKKEYFLDIRDQFNASHQPHHFLYLLARIVKGSVRYSSSGSFNQSPDNRRSGMRPAAMRRQIIAVSALLSGKTTLSAVDFREVIAKAEKTDLIYLDPPYQGTSFTRDHRYLSGLPYDEFVVALQEMNRKDISYIVSYDGQTGNKSHGKKLPRTLSLTHLYINAGRSSQSTLLGNTDETIESLYLSPALVDRLNNEKSRIPKKTRLAQQESVFA